MDAKGNRVRPEFGNIEHVNAIRNYEAIQNGSELDISVGSATAMVNADFVCTSCGEPMNIYGEVDFDPDLGVDDIDVSAALAGEEATCKCCGQKHTLERTGSTSSTIKAVASLEKEAARA